MPPVSGGHPRRVGCWSWSRWSRGTTEVERFLAEPRGSDLAVALIDLNADRLASSRLGRPQHGSDATARVHHGNVRQLGEQHRHQADRLLVRVRTADRLHRRVPKDGATVSAAGERTAEDVDLLVVKLPRER